MRSILHLLNELADALEAWDRGSEVRCIIVTGSDRAFAAGADIKEMAPKNPSRDVPGEFLRRSASTASPRIKQTHHRGRCGPCAGRRLRACASPCDFIIAADTAKFGQPEITLGIMPGLGGSQRLTRFVGKSKAMEMCLTGRTMDAAEAEAQRPRQPRGAGWRC